MTSSALDAAVSSIPRADVTNLTTDLAARVVGPASATDNAVARFDTTTGKLIQNSNASIDDGGNLTANYIAATPEIQVSGSTFAATRYTDASQATDQKVWFLINAGGVLAFTPYTDGGVPAITYGLRVSRNGNVDVFGALAAASAAFTSATSATAVPGTSSSVLATTQFVALSFAPLASPALTGTPTVPTASASTNTTQAASTAFVQTAISPAVTTWTPTDASGASLSLTISFARYVVLGYLVFFTFDLTYPTTSNTNNATIGGLPYTTAGQSYGAVMYSDAATADHVIINNGVTSMLVLNASHAGLTNANLSGKILRVSGWYFRV